MCAAWKGALDYRGFPVNVAFYAQKKSTRGAGFKIVGPDGQPPVNKSFMASKPKQTLTPDDMGKAVLVGKGRNAVLHTVSPEAVEQITSSEKTQVMEASSFAPLETIPLEHALMSYVVLPDPEVAGADRSAKLIWNGLRSTKLAYVAQATIASGDAIVVVYATETELRAVTLPFVAEMYPKGSYDWEVDQDMGNVFAESLGDAYVIAAFEHGNYASQYEARRQEIVQKVIDGNEVTVVEPAAKTASTPDLMSLLQASVGEAKPKKAKTTEKKKKELAS